MSIVDRNRLRISLVPKQDTPTPILDFHHSIQEAIDCFSGSATRKAADPTKEEWQTHQYFIKNAFDIARNINVEFMR